MKTRDALERLSTHSHRLVIVISCLLIAVVAIRRWNDLDGFYTTGWLAALLGVFTVLFISEPLITRKFRSYYRIYFIVQVILIQWVGLFREYQDTWVMLYIVLGLQVPARGGRKEALAWLGFFTILLFSTLLFEFGWVSGPGRAMAYTVIGVLVISYDIQYAQHEDTLKESQLLVAELKEANEKLAVYTAQAKALAAIQEHNRIVKELYDSVGQKVFAIQLAAETTHIMLEKDPDRASAQLNGLQAQTQSALGQMRQLIEQWRPG